MKTVIVSGGNVNDAFVKDYLKEYKADYYIGVDRGIGFFVRNEILPNLIVGDFDSCDKEDFETLEAKYKEKLEIIKLFPEKDDTDTEHALVEAIKRGSKEIVIFGGTGSRLDHVLANITMLGLGLADNNIAMPGLADNKAVAREELAICLVDEHNRIRMIDKELTIKKNEQFGKYFSLIPFTPEVRGLTVKGAKYPVENFIMGGFKSLGVSNEIVDEKVEIKFESGLLLVIESRD